ncbi:Pentatricopeptide repeat-containing protein [Heracleum sosnowskyi]|uniref:Pentatricopeptide repeat-containing protein n=1 Tax=Heracleum sosnowskyi TaxID=360622 RepID=A0AAD8GYT1_9APIA|nr:Pentatricopeptide repeat-containing protein [Heracleum sosnowskyi]
MLSSVKRATSNKIITKHCPIHTSSSHNYVKFIEIYGHDRALQSGKALHGHLVVSGLSRSTHYASKLLAFYAECRQLCDARKVFDRIPQSNVRRWIVLVGAYARHGFHQEAMDVFCEMQREGVEPNKFVFPSILKASGHLSDRRTGENIHTAVLKNGFESDAFVISALVDMYAKCGRIEKARSVFDNFGKKDLVTLNVMVSGYVHHRYVEEALELVKEMQVTAIKPNVVTWNILIAGFSQAGDESMVAKLFRLMQDSGVEPDVVSWTSVISGFVQNFQYRDAFDMFKKMLGIGMFPTSVTISSLLPACATLADLKHGTEIHSYAVVRGFEKDTFVSSALIDMYSKCGSIYEAKTLFTNMSERNTVTWNSMIFGYANHGYCKEAIQLFNQMVDEGETKVDHLTFTAALTACSLGGMTELGQALFQSMQENYCIKPRSEHYACVVDLMGKAGKIVEAYDIIQKMPIERDKFVWGALLGACKQHGNVDIAEIAAKHLSKLEPESAGSSLVLSSLYMDAGSWRDSARVKRSMKKRKLEKLPGCSWIDST